ncbi:two-component system, sensor histidine kinase and response regulator [Gammaproteobacteria bacterium]
MIRLVGRITRLFIVVVAVAITSLIIGGIWFYQTQKQMLRHQNETTLQTIAQLKVNTLTQWRSERFSNTAVLMESPLLGTLIEDWQKNPQPRLTNQLLAKFHSLQDHYRYSDVQLVDRLGRIQLSLMGHTGRIDESEEQALSTAWREHKTQLSDLHQDTDDPFPHITGIAPFFREQETTEPLAAILLRTDARQFLYPFLQSWPIPTKSGESLLVEQKDDTVVFLNNLRYQPDSALKLHIPLPQSEVPAVMAIRSRLGLVYGADYRGIEVVAVIAAVPDSPWFLVTKIDLEEALADWRAHSPLILAIILMLIATVAAVAAVLMWRRIAQSYHQDLFRTEQARRQGEENLQHLETRYRTYFEQSRDGIGMVDAFSQRILDANDAWCRMLGYTREELLQRTILELEGNIPQETAERVGAIRTQGWAEFEAPMIHKDGRVLNTLVTAKQVEIDGHPRLLGTVRDITEQKRAETALRETQERLQLIFNSTTNGLLVANDGGRIVMTNPALETLLGYAPNELLGKPVELLVPVEKRDWHVELRHAFFMTPSHHIHNVTREVHAQHRDGHEIPIELSLNRFDNAEERLALAMVIDITERIHAKMELERSRENWRNLAEAMPHMVWSCAPDGHPDYVSHQWVDYTGDSDMGNWFNRLHPEDRERTLAAWTHSVRTGENYDLEYRIRRYDGVYRWFKVRGTPVRCPEGGILKWHGCNIDIENIKQSEWAAEQANRAKSEFLANMSHEIRTPMNAIIGLTQLVLETELTSKQQDYLQKVKNSAHALLGILNDILDYSKLEAGQLTLEAVDFRLDDIFHNLSALFSFQAEEKGVEIFFEIVPPLPTALNGDPLRLGQILNNLVGNAVKFTEHGEIHIKAERARNNAGENQIYFTVRDTGIGMTKEQLGRLFHSFSQGDPSTTRKYGGTGLGLTISKRLIEQMGGKITVGSVLGQGSAFCFTIPLCPAREALPQRKIGPVRGMRTLVVDDQETSLEILDHMLNSWSFNVVLAHSGAEGLEKVDAALQAGNPFELILIDWKMPGMDGIELAKRLREQESKIGGGRQSLVIMVTAFGREEVLQAATGIPLDAVLEKPVIPSLLFDVTADLQYGKMRALGQKPVADPPDRLELFEMTRPIHGARLLLVEDNATNQIVAQGFLEKMGLRIEIAHHGREAVDKVAHQDYDAVLMDLQMPEMDGFEASRKIRATARGRNLPIIAMTAAAMQEDKQAAAAAGMNDHLAKPIDALELATALLKWIQPGKHPLPPVVEGNTEVLRSEKPKELPVASPFELPGLDLATAAQRLAGDWSLLRTMLLSFLADFADAGKKLEHYLTTGAHSEAIRLVHTVKGLGKPIGATELALLAEQFEHELQTGIEISQAPFTAALQAVLAAITILSPPPSPTTTLPTPDKPHLRRILRELATLLESSATIPDTLLEELRTRLTGQVETGMLDTLITQVELFAFVAAQRTLEKMATDLGLDLND